MKTFLTIIILAVSLVGCTRKSSATLVGTLIGVSESGEWKKCDFGTIKIQPATVGGEIINVYVDDMTPNRKKEIEQFLSKKVKISVEKVEPPFGCDTSEIKITEVE